MSIEIIKPGTKYNFVGNRYYAFIFSGALLLMSIVSIIWHQGLNLGVDFKGGLEMQIRTLDSAIGTEQLREAISKGGLTVSSIKDYGQGGNEFLVNILPSDTPQQALLSQNVTDTLAQNLGGVGKFEVRRVEMVGPSVGNDQKQQALYAVYYSILIIIIYISGRFEKKWASSALFMAILIGAVYLLSIFKVGVGILIISALIVTLITCYFMRFSYALGGIIALIHDVAITTGFFSLLDKEITISFVAAILTIIGYSLNDSIIVFDRIRERVGRDRKSPFSEIINKSINETLSRTILTSGTTLVALICLYTLGGPVNRDFALALLIGISIGTISSIFIASPILLFFEKKKKTA